MKFSEILKSDSESASNIQIIKDCVQLQSNIPDEDWILYIILFIRKFYENCDKSTIRFLNEKQITRQIRFYLLKDDDFNVMGFIVNSESENNNKRLGFYDLKIEHSGWRNNYLAFECKLMDETSDRIGKYIHTPPYASRDEDGGLYRFLINKYASDKTVGGMLGYVIDGDINTVISHTKKKLLDFSKKEGEISFGEVSNPNLLNSKSFDSPNSFISEHTKYDSIKRELCDMKIMIHHIFLDFI